jgi:hypothetical protein
MKPKQPFLAGALLLATAGCDSLDTTQFVVRNASSRDQHAIVQTVDVIAADARFEKKRTHRKSPRRYDIILSQFLIFPSPLA